jgi:predicted small lipoprotein YifL
MAGKAGVMKAALALLALVALAGCGRVGPPRAPGPANQVIYPRGYPAPPKDSTAPILPAPVMPNVPLAVPTR